MVYLLVVLAMLLLGGVIGFLVAYFIYRDDYDPYMDDFRPRPLTRREIETNRKRMERAE